jgi:hypothetical protein
VSIRNKISLDFMRTIRHMTHSCECRRTEIDRQYSFEDFRFDGACEDQTLRVLQVLGADVFCDSTAFEDLRSEESADSACPYASEKDII